MCKDKKEQESYRKSSPKISIKKKLRQVKQDFLEGNVTDAFNNLFKLTSDKDKPITMQIVVENHLTDFELDSGSPVSAISQGFFAKSSVVEIKSKQHVKSLPYVFGRNDNSEWSFKG